MYFDVSRTQDEFSAVLLDKKVKDKCEQEENVWTILFLPCILEKSQAQAKNRMVG